ncbi:MAG TPA: hypothetical protein VEC94_14290 [Pseudolabrys sp.]|nr:hypothetical protein [Pseudolabrys sp.]
MTSDTAIDRVKSELNRAFEKTRVELDRIELLAVSLAAFSKPIPDYEPRFHHLRKVSLAARELSSD